jgi:hypothetical protein
LPAGRPDRSAGLSVSARGESWWIDIISYFFGMDVCHWGKDSGDIITNYFLFVVLIYHSQNIPKRNVRLIAF